MANKMIALISTF